MELKPEHNIVRWAKEYLEIGETQKVSVKLQQVRGIGPKIVAFFLRDVADAFGLDITDPEEAILLQPIDRWTRRGAEFLASLVEVSKPKRVEECAWVLLNVAQRARVRPTLVNSGLWVLGAKFAETEGELRKAFSNPEKCLQQWREECRSRLELLEALVQDFS